MLFLEPKVTRLLDESESSVRVYPLEHSDGVYSNVTAPPVSTPLRVVFLVSPLSPDEDVCGSWLVPTPLCLVPSPG